MNTSLDPELAALRDSLLDMVDLVIKQVERCKKAIQKSDLDTARSLRDGEKQLNEMELDIDRDCENILALHQPVATDLRFILAALKMSNDLERIGDNLKVFSKLIEAGLEKERIDILHKFSFEAYFAVFHEYLDNIRESLKSGDTSLAKKILKNHEVLDKRKDATKDAAELILDHPDKAKLILRTYSMVQRMGRIGSLIKNVSEEIIFYREAKVLKHSKKSEK